MARKNRLNDMVKQGIEWISENARPLVGILLLVAGLAFIIRARDILFDLVIFSVGLFLVYYSLHFFRLTALTKLIDRQLKNLRSIFN